jgi:hypothetical protein
MLPLHHSHHEYEAGTTGLEPAIFRPSNHNRASLAGRSRTCGRSGRPRRRSRGAQSRRGGHAPYGQKMKWEEGFASLDRGGALLRTLPDAIRCSSARLPATVVDRQGDALSP